MKSKIHGTVTFLLATIISQLPFNVFAATPSAPVPASPGPFQLSAAARCVGGSPEIDLSWTMSKGATRYDVYRNGSHLYNVLTSQTFKNQLVAPGTAYSYSVKASNVSGKAQTSNSVSAKAPTCVASTPPRSTVVASQPPPSYPPPQPPSSSTSVPSTVRPITPVPTPSTPPQMTPVPSTARPAVTLPSTLTPSQIVTVPSVNRPITPIPSTPAPSAIPSQIDIDRQGQVVQQQVSPPATNVTANTADIQRLQRDTTIAQLGNYGRTPGGIVDFRTGQIVAPSTTTAMTTPSQTAPSPAINRPTTTVPAVTKTNPAASTSQPNLAALQQQLLEKQKQLEAAKQQQAKQTKPQPPSPPATNVAANNADIQRLQRDTTIAQSGNYGRTPGGIVDLRTGQIVAPSPAPTVNKTQPPAPVSPPSGVTQSKSGATTPTISGQPSQAQSDAQKQDLLKQLAQKQKELADAQQKQAQQAKPQQPPSVTTTPATNPDIQKLQKDTTLAQSGNYGRTPGGIVDLRTGQIVAPSPASSVNRTQPPAPVSRPSAVTQSKPASTAPTMSGQPSQAHLDAQKQDLLKQLAQKQKELADARQKQAQQAKPQQPPPVTTTPATNPDIQKLQKDTTLAQSKNYGRTPGGIVDLRTGQLVAPSMVSSPSKPESSQSTRLPQPTKPVARPQVAGVQTGVQKPAVGLTAIEKQNAAERTSAVNVASARGTVIPQSRTTSTTQPVSTGSPVRLVSPGTIASNTAGTTPMTLNDISTGAGASSPSYRFDRYGNWGGLGYPAIDCKDTAKINSRDGINDMDRAFKNHDLAYCAAQNLPIVSAGRVEAIFNADMQLINKLKAITEKDLEKKPFRSVREDWDYRNEALRYFENKTISQPLTRTWKASTDYLAGLMGPDPSHNWFYRNTNWIDHPFFNGVAKGGEVIVGEFQYIEKLPAVSRGVSAVASDLVARAGQDLGQQARVGVDRAVDRMESSLQRWGQQARAGLQSIENSVQSVSQQARTGLGRVIHKLQDLDQ